MPRFKLHLLGSPRVVGDAGILVELPLGKPLAALAYVALEPASASRVRLAGMLWPGAPAPRARASIRQALWFIRKQTVQEVLVEANDRLSLNPDVIDLDVHRLASALDGGRLDAALALWSTGLLDGFTVPDAQPWLTWADDVKSRWEARVGRAFEAKARESHGAQRVRWLHRAIGVRSYRPETWHALASVLIDQRDIEGASEALDGLRRVAEHEDRQLVQAAEDRLRLLRRSVYGDPEERLVPDFVGRSTEFSVLMASWRDVLSRRSRVVGLLGPHGMGKTALADEAVRHALLDEANVVEVRGTRTEVDMELGVVGSVAAELLKRPGAAGISPGSGQVLRALVPSGGEFAEVVPRTTMVADALGDLMDAVSQEAPVVLLIDDAHWMDKPSGMVLLRAVRQLHGARVLMLWTCTTGGSQGHGARAIEHAAEDDLATLVKLGPLRKSEIAEMITLLLSERDAGRIDELSDQLHLATGGWPLHLVELLRDLRDRGLVARDRSGNWTLDDDVLQGMQPPSASLPEALEQRVHGLSHDARRLGVLLSDRAGAIAPEELRSLAPAHPERVDRAVAELLRRGLVRWTRDDRVRLAHELLGQAFSSAAAAPESDAVPERSRAKSMVAVSLVSAVLIALATLAQRSSATPDDLPFGGGTIWLRDAVGFHSVTYRGGESAWEWGDTVRIPAGFHARGHPQRSSEGSYVLVGAVASDSESALDAAIVRDGEVQQVFSSEGDDLLQAVDPSVQAGILSVQHPDTTQFRHMLVRINLDQDGDTAVLATGTASYGGTAWSATGERLLVHVDAPWDTLLITDPGGRRLGVLPSPHKEASATSPCGPDQVLVETRPPAALPEFWIWKGDWAEAVRINLRLLPATTPTCSPDGSAVVYLHRHEERTTLVLDPLDGGPLAQLDIPAMGISHTMWAQPAQPAPTALRITGAAREMARGERRRLSSEVLGRDGEPLVRAVTWSSSDPTVVSVGSGGLATANRPGRVVVRGTVDGWLAGEVTITVNRRALDDRLALTDSFTTLDSLRWVPLGSGELRPVRVDGEPALLLGGDGLYADGIGSVDGFDLTLGGRLEAVFWMDPFRRTDRNRITLCLHDGAVSEPPGEYEAWRLDQRACVRWPADEGFDFDPASIALSTGAQPLGAIAVDTLLGTSRWNRLGLEVQPDGKVSAIIGDSVVATHPVRLVNDSDATWHAVVIGHSVDNRLLLRDLSLWTSPTKTAEASTGGRTSPEPPRK